MRQLLCGASPFIKTIHTGETAKEYVPRGTNVLQPIFKKHFTDFTENYDEKYSKAYGKYRLDRITEVVKEFLKCGDYKEGIARVKCTNPLMWS